MSSLTLKQKLKCHRHIILHGYYYSKNLKKKNCVSYSKRKLVLTSGNIYFSSTLKDKKNTDTFVQTEESKNKT